MEKERFDILERVCATTDSNHHFFILKAEDHQNGDIVWAIGDDQVCAVTSGDFLRDRSISYQDVCIQEFPYRDSTPESVGAWLPLIQELVEETLQAYLKHDGTARVFPQWLPDSIEVGFGKEIFQELSAGIDYIILHKDNTMEMVARTD